jgi:two-component system nitrate/nitrite response regulator NarL
MTRIAIIDDHHILLDGLKWVVNQYHFVDEVTAFTSADKFIEALEAGEEFTAVITDLQMPGTNGHELIDILKSQFGHIRILVMTMFDSPFVIRKVIESKADGFFIKQGDQSALEEALRTVLKGETYLPDDMKELAAIHAADNMVLTKRENEILKLIATEQAVRSIAEQLFISEDTVVTHRKNIMGKLNIHTTAGLVAFAIKNNLI